MKKTGMLIFSALLLLSINLNLHQIASAETFIEKGEINGVSYATGGVGIEERQAMEKMAGDFNVKVVLAGESGSYLSGLMVYIEDMTGKMVFECVTKGPWLYVDLPPGTYRVTSSYNHNSKMQQVKVGEGLRKVIFQWNT